MRWGLSHRGGNRDKKQDRCRGSCMMAAAIGGGANQADPRAGIRVGKGQGRKEGWGMGHGLYLSPANI